MHMQFIEPILGEMPKLIAVTEIIEVCFYIIFLDLLHYKKYPLIPVFGSELTDAWIRVVCILIAAGGILLAPVLYVGAVTFNLGCRAFITKFVWFSWMDAT